MSPAPTADAPASPPNAAPELRLARAGTLLALAVGAPVVGAAGLLAGWPGALGAGVGVALVITLLGLTGVALAWAAPLGPGALAGAALGGFVLRLLAYVLLLALLGPVEAVHKPSLAIATAVVLVITLVGEVRLVSRAPGFWTVHAGRSDS